MRVLCIHHEDDSSLCTLERPVRERGHVLEHWLASREPSPPPGSYGAVYVLGGVAHPDQEATYPWLTGELRVIDGLLRAGVPALGVCLGAQLVARALGGRVDKLPAPEIGWFEVERRPVDDPLLDAFPSSFPAFQWHRYGFEPPPGGVSLARSQRAPHQAMRVGDRVWALQFHIEADAPTIADWTLQGRDDLAANGVDRQALLADSARYAAAYVELAHELSHRFLAVAERCAAPAPVARA